MEVVDVGVHQSGAIINSIVLCCAPYLPWPAFSMACWCEQPGCTLDICASLSALCWLQHVWSSSLAAFDMISTVSPKVEYLVFQIPRKCVFKNGAFFHRICNILFLFELRIALRCNWAFLNVNLIYFFSNCNACSAFLVELTFTRTREGSQEQLTCFVPNSFFMTWMRRYANKVGCLISFLQDSKP